MLLPAALFLVAVAAVRATGVAMRIPWDYYHLLDGKALAAHPLASLCALHSQPPGLNTLLAGVLAVATMLGVAPVRVADLLFLGFGLVGTVALFRLVLELTASWALAVAAAILLLVDPGWHLGLHLFFYEHPTGVLLVLVAGAARSYVLHGGRRRLAAVVLAIAATAWLRALFHPLWALAVLGLVAHHRRRAVAPDGRAAVRREALGAGIVLAGLLAFWSVKNAVVFGIPTDGSMTGVNIARNVPSCPGVAVELPDPEALVARAVARCGPAAADVLVPEYKSNGAPNWNRVGFLVALPYRVRCGIVGTFQHWRAWLARAGTFYVLWGRPSYVHPYGLVILGPMDPRYRAWTRLHQAVFFADLRPLVARVLPSALATGPKLGAGRVPWTLFGFVLFPILAAFGAVAALDRRGGPRALVAGIALVTVLSALAVICLTDGAEGNRMRISSIPLLLVLAAASLPRRRSAPDAPPPD
jgi:hypothetical protein